MNNKYENTANDKERERESSLANLICILPFFLMIAAGPADVQNSIILAAFSVIGCIAFIDWIKKLDEFSFFIVAKSSLYSIAASFPILGFFSILNTNTKFDTNGIEIFATLWVLFIVIYIILNRKLNKS